MEPVTQTATDPLVIAGRALRSRLILGTGGFTRLETLADAIRATNAELVTVALRRIDPKAPGSLVAVLEECGYALLPNTAGCYTAATRCAPRRWRASSAERLVKVEVMGDEHAPPRRGPSCQAASSW